MINDPVATARGSDTVTTPISTTQSDPIAPPSMPARAQTLFQLPQRCRFLRQSPTPAQKPATANTCSLGCSPALLRPVRSTRRSQSAQLIPSRTEKDYVDDLPRVPFSTPS